MLTKLACFSWQPGRTLDSTVAIAHCFQNEYCQILRAEAFFKSHCHFYLLWCLWLTWKLPGNKPYFLANSYDHYFFYVASVGSQGLSAVFCLFGSFLFEDKSIVATGFDFCLSGHLHELLCEQSTHATSSSCVAISAFYHCSCRAVPLE